MVLAYPIQSSVLTGEFMAPSISRSKARPSESDDCGDTDMTSLKRILLVEDSPRDAELTLNALPNTTSPTTSCIFGMARTRSTTCFGVSRAPTDLTVTPPWCCWT